MESVILTGASDGIGRAMAFAFARRGLRIGLIARRVELLERVASECKALGSPDVEFRCADVTDSAAFRRALGELDDWLGGASLFVANAGVGFNLKPDRDSFEQSRKMIEVNLTAAVDGLEFMKARMLGRGRGRLVGVSSVAGARGLPGSPAYSATKAALRVYLESLRMELRAYGIQVTEIAPGFIATAMTQGNNPAAMPFLMKVSDAADTFVEQTLAGKETIVAPWQFKPIFWLLKVLPQSFMNAIGYRIARSDRKLDRSSGDDSSRSGGKKPDGGGNLRLAEPHDPPSPSPRDSN